MEKKQCRFCKIYQEKKEVIFENKYFYIQFDKFPVSPGHAEVIPKRHVVSFFQLKKEERNTLVQMIEKAVKIIESTDLETLYADLAQSPLNEKSNWFCQDMLNHIGINKKPDGYNYGVNEGEAAGRTIHHLHIHVIPRYKGDVKDPRGGVRHVISKYGNYS